MMKRLLIGTASASLLAIGSATGVALADDSVNTTNGQPAVVAPQPPAANSGTAIGTGANGTETDTGDTGAGSSMTSAPAAEAAPVIPPPSDAVISAQGAGEVRADQLIGMTVFNSGGDKVGTVHDILFDQNGKATGVVLSVGGVLGIGAKSVGLTWKELDVKPDQQAVQISYTKDQLEAAPDFKTSEQIKAEMNAQQPLSPAPGGGTQTQQP